MATSIVDALLHELFEQFKDIPAIIDHLTEVRRSMIENIEEFQPRPQMPEGPFPTPSARDPQAVLRKYAVNLLATRAQDSCPGRLRTEPDASAPVRSN